MTNGEDQIDPFVWTTVSAKADADQTATINAHFGCQLPT